MRWDGNEPSEESRGCGGGEELAKDEVAISVELGEEGRELAGVARERMRGGCTCSF